MKNGTICEMTKGFNDKTLYINFLYFGLILDQLQGSKMQ